MDQERLLGGKPLAVIIRLVILSIVVGIVLQALHITPADLIYRLNLIVDRIYEMGFGVFRRLLEYLVVGAVVVVPIWLVMRLLGAGRQRAGDK